MSAFNPAITSLNVTGISSGNYLIDASGEKHASMFLCPHDMTLEEIDFFVGTVTTGSTLTITVETVSAGLPTGSLIAAGASGTVTTTAGTDNNTIKTVALTTPQTLSKGEHLAIVIEQSTGNCQILRNSGNFVTAGNAGAPSGSLYTTSWGNAVHALVWLGDDNGDRHTIHSELYGYQVQTANGSTVDCGNVFTPAESLEIVGALLVMRHDATRTGDTLTLYDSSNAVIDTIQTFDAVLSGTNSPPEYAYFDAPITLTAGQSYRLVYKRNGAGNVRENSLVMPATLKTPLGLYTDFKRTTRTGGGAWTDSTDRFSVIMPLISGTVAASGGGLLTHPGMSGGMRG